MVEASNVTKELETELLAISQLSQDLEGLMSEGVSHSNCSLPYFEQDKDKYQFVRCLLELLDEVLSNIKPWFHHQFCILKLYFYTCIKLLSIK